ncbi:uncharacterized protein LOC143604327 [Bidens hawaiensis]|uniref:uncharacterized protein LOC143604327 n=1 Tax=Bidens hawaiensis TaxID=980011 RepID=UPI0040492357
MLNHAFLDYDFSLNEDEPPALTAESTPTQHLLFEKWKRCNLMSLMLIKNSISMPIKGSIPDYENVKTYLAFVEEQFKGTSKAHSSTLILKMVTTKYDGKSGIRGHIMMMNDMAHKLKGLDMEISDGFLVHFIMTSLPAAYEVFKINYKTQKDKWTMSELIAMCVQEEERMKMDKPEVAYLATSSKNRKNTNPRKEFAKVQKTNTGASTSSQNSTRKPFCKFCKKYIHK